MFLVLFYIFKGLHFVKGLWVSATSIPPQNQSVFFIVVVEKKRCTHFCFVFWSLNHSFVMIGTFLLLDHPGLYHNIWKGANKLSWASITFYESPRQKGYCIVAGQSFHGGVNILTRLTLRWVEGKLTQHGCPPVSSFIKRVHDGETKVAYNYSTSLPWRGDSK